MGHRPDRPRPSRPQADRDQGDDGLRTAWEIRTPGEFDAVLDELCQPIPGRGSDQISELRERWTLGHALRADQYVFGGPYPIKIVKQECPDFRLDYSTGSVGVEIVEAIPRQLAHACAVVNAAVKAGEPLPDVLSFRHLQSERKSTTHKEIMSRIDPRNAEPWIGDEPERHWLQVVGRVIVGKCSKSSGYSDRRNLHLLINDEVGGCADPERTWRLLLAQNDLMIMAGAAFAAIHVLSHRRLYSKRFA